MPRATVATTKGTAPTKKTTASKPRARTTPSVDSVAPPSPAPEGEILTTILSRLEVVEEKIVGSVAALVEELRTFKEALTPPAAPDTELPPESTLPLVADLLRKNLMEHLTPVTAAIKRLEERVGFVANRLRQGGGGSGGGGGGGQDRPKPWRQDQGRHQRPPRGQQNTQRPNPPQPQQWTPPSAASVQGHFAPRPLRGGGFVEEED
jgi:hypothetical protein